MSGHSHWATIKRGKEAEDKKRGKVFSKMSRIISIAAKDGGGDPESNPKLKTAIEKAKAVNLPKDNIEKAIKKGTGETNEKINLEELMVEAFGPGGVGILVTAITDNKNRTLGEIKQIINQMNGKVAGEGSVKWQFERKGVILINNSPKIENKEEAEMNAIEAGADDILWVENGVEIYTKPEELEKVKKNLEDKGLKADSYSLDWVPKETVEVEERTKNSLEKMFELLDENDDVQDIYSNIK